MFIAQHVVDNQSGTVHLAAVSLGERTTSQAQNDVLFKLNITALSPGEAVLHVSNLQLGDATGNALNANASDATISIAASPTATAMPATVPTEFLPLLVTINHETAAYSQPSGLPEDRMGMVSVGTRDVLAIYDTEQGERFYQIPYAGGRAWVIDLKDGDVSVLDAATALPLSSVPSSPTATINPGMYTEAVINREVTAYSQPSFAPEYVTGVVGVGTRQILDFYVDDAGRVFYQIPFAGGRRWIVDLHTGDIMLESNPNASALRATNQGFIPTSTATRSELSVSVSSANLRSGPDTNFSVVGSAVRGDTFEIIARTNNAAWYLIDQGNGTSAWISTTVVTVVAPVISIPIAATVPAAPPNVLGSSGAGASPTYEIVSYRVRLLEQVCVKERCRQAGTEGVAIGERGGSYPYFTVNFPEDPGNYTILPSGFLVLEECANYGCTP